MTTIVGLQGKDWAVVGADSRISTMDENGLVMSQTTLPESSSKLSIKGSYIIGAAGDVRAINLLHHIYEPPALPRIQTAQRMDQHVTQRIIPSLRACFDTHGYSPPDKQERDHQAEQNSTVLICVRARIYIIDTDYSWAQDNTGIYTTGTGHQYARAALHVLTGNSTKGLTMTQAIEVTAQALDIAATHDPYTGGPHHIYTQTGKATTKKR